MLTLWTIGSIVLVLLLFLCYAIFKVASRADEYEQAEYRRSLDTLIVEESASEDEKMIHQYK